MNRRLLAGVLALLALWHGQQASAVGSEIFYKPGEVPFGQVHRQPPGSIVAPYNPSAAVRAEIKATLSGIPADLAWEAVTGRNTSPVSRPMRFLKGGLRSVGYAGAIVLVAEGMNYLLSKGLDSLKDQASGNELAQCAAFAASRGAAFGPEMPCSSTPGHESGMYEGPYPTTPYTNVQWADTPTAQQLISWDNVYGSDGQKLYNIMFSCTPPTGEGHSLSKRGIPRSEVQYWVEFSQAACSRPPVVTTLTDLIEGNPSKGVSPHPWVRDQVRDAMTIGADVAPLEPGGRPFPGTELSPLPSKNQWYGTPVAPGEDIDGDGWSDAEEVKRGSDPNERTSVPDTSRDTDGDGVADRDEDRLYTNPYDPTSTPSPDETTDTDGDGVSDADDDDIDGDGWSNDEERSSGSDPRSPTSRPSDMDRDGIPDASDPDADGDGFTNEEELSKGTNPDDPESKPEPEDKPLTCAPGSSPSADGKSCAPDKSDDTCKDGEHLDTSTPPVCVPDTDPKGPVSDNCGDMSLPRFTAHTGHWLRDLFVSCEPENWLNGVREQLLTKYPFSMIGALKDGLVSTPTGPASGQAAMLPSKVGPFALEWDWVVGLITVVGLLFKAWTGILVVDIVLSRLMGQVVIK